MGRGPRRSRSRRARCHARAVAQLSGGPAGTPARRPPGTGRDERPNLEWSGESQPLRPSPRSVAARASAEPDGQGTWLDLGEGRRRPPRTPSVDAPAAAEAPPSRVPEEPEWLRERARRAGPRRCRARRSTRRRSRPRSRPAAQARAEEIVSRLNPEQARAVDHDRGPAADPRGRRVGQDPRHRPPDRVPHRRQGRPAAADPRGHVHQPRRRRAPRADHRPRRRARQGRRGGHVPRAVRARAPPRRRGDRARPAVRHLRHGRPAAADEADPGRGGPAGDRRVPAGRDPRRDQPGQERDARRDVPRRERRQPPRADRSPASRRATGSGSRAANALDFDDLLLKAVDLFERGARGAREVPRALALPPRRRVPGHEPAAVPVGPGARRRPIATCAWWATTTSRSTAGGARTSRTSSTSSATTPRRRSSSSSRTTARRSSSSTPPTRSSRATSAGPTRSCGPRTRAACRSSASRRSTRRRRPSGSRARSRAWSGSTGRGSWLTRRADDDESTRFRPKDVAVMYRMNAQSRAIEEAFLRYGIRYQLVGGTRFYQRREVKDALAYLRVLRSDTDGVLVRADHQRPGARDRRQERRGAAAVRRSSTRTTRSRRSRPRPRGRGRGPRRRGSGPRIGGVRGARAPAADADRRAAAARAARRGPRGVRLPGDARRRVRGGRGPLGEPARAARR